MAGLFGLFNNNTYKKEITKEDAEKRTFFRFWELFFLKFSKMLAGNLLYILCCIPVLLIVFAVSGVFSSNIFELLLPQLSSYYGTIDESTLNNPDFMQLFVYFDVIIRAFISVLFVLFLGSGPVTCAFNHIVRNYVKDKHAWVFSDFFEKSHKNFKQGFVVLLFDVIIFFFLFNSYFFYSTQNEMLSFVKYFILSIGVIFILMHIYIYPLMLTFKLPLKHILKNSIILALSNLPRNLFVFVVNILMFVLIPYMLFINGYIYACIIGYLVLFILILPAFSLFFTNFIIAPVIDDLISKADN